MLKSLASNFLTLLILILMAVSGVIYWGQRVWVTPGPLAEAVCVSVPRGASMAGMSDRLQDQGAISDARVFRIGSDYTERSERLKAGNFLVPAGASMEEISVLLSASGQSTCGSEVIYRIGVTRANLVLRDINPATGRYETAVEFGPDDPRPAGYQAFLEDGFGSLRVAVAEGVTSWQIVDSLERLDVLSGEVGRVPSEGTLAPGSYEVSVGGDRSSVLVEMETRQTDFLTAAWVARADGLPLETPLEALTLASIVEKETAEAEERALVAGVFINRLERGMRLQTDPTVIYGITQGQGTLGRGLRRSELDRYTPYNTYRIDGLPPGPIANPGQAAIEAALNPAETDYVFFVADGTGGHAFAETLAEHNANVRRWRQIERENASRSGQ